MQLSWVTWGTVWFYVLPHPCITYSPSPCPLVPPHRKGIVITWTETMVIVSEWTWIFRFTRLHYHINFAQECQNIVRFNRNTFNCFSSPSANISRAFAFHKTQWWRIHHLAVNKAEKWDTWIILPVEFNKKYSLSPDLTNVYSMHILSIQLQPRYSCQSAVSIPQFLPHFHNPTSGDTCSDQPIWAITLPAM